MKKLKALLVKDYLIDLRQKYPIAGILLYIFATIYISYLAFSQSINATTWNAAFWVILLFISVTSIAKGFNQEENRSAYYFFLAKPSTILFAKLIYHSIYQTILVFITFFLFQLLLGDFISNSLLFFINLCLGNLGIAVAFTLISSLAAKADNQSNMMAVLAFPAIIPVLILSVSNSRKIILGAAFSDISGNIFNLISVIVIIIALAFILFPYSWKN
jgi:heme exporter protein B